jgi:dihydrodipicolinate reductase
MTEESTVFFLSLVLIAGALLFALVVNLSKKGAKKLDKQYFRAKCLEIEHQLKKDEPSSYAMSVFNYDKLLDQALKSRGARGSTMGDRLKSSGALFSDRNGVWTAHKLRNRIAHESDVRVKYEESRYALNRFRQALKDIGAI